MIEPNKSMSKPEKPETAQVKRRKEDLMEIVQETTPDDNNKIHFPKNAPSSFHAEKKEHEDIERQIKGIEQVLGDEYLSRETNVKIEYNHALANNMLSPEAQWRIKIKDYKNAPEPAQLELYTEPNKEWEKLKSTVKGLGKWIKRGLGIGVAVTAASLSTNAQENKHHDIKETTPMVRNEGKAEYDFGSMRKVTTAPKGYDVVAVVDGKTILERKVKDGKLEKAKKGGPEADPVAYDIAMKEKIKKGITPEQLADGGYIKPDVFLQYYKQYKDSIDRVYMEPEKSINKKEETKEVKKEDPYAKYAQRGTPIYGPNDRIVAEMCYPTVKSKAVTNTGNENTQKVNGLLRFRNDFGFTGPVIELTSKELGDRLKGTDHFQLGKDYNDLLAKASEEKIENNSDIVKNK